jgi:multidrug efflux pump subunit AcrA (membrane-fusion protein)
MRPCTVVLLFALACQGGGGSGAVDAGAAEPGDGGAEVPVKVAQIVRMDLAVDVSAPGQTAALEVQKVNAPFAGRLVALDVADGDTVQRHQVLGKLMAAESVSALDGAKRMVDGARTAQQRRDATRALELAKANAVALMLRAPERAVVVSHEANAGSTVAADQVLLTLAAVDSVAFIAQLVQTDLSQIAPGESAQIDLAGMSNPLPGKVHAILANANPAALRVPVRIDFVPPRRVALGIFGTARIVVATHQGAVAAPAAAVLRDDVSGISRIAVVRQDSRAHWIDVNTGIAQRGFVELVRPTLRPGETVVVAGQVGLPDGAQVRVQP